MTTKEFEEKQSDSRPQERKPAEVRRFEILYAAKELFCERGFERVSMDEVAEKVGVSKAAIYLYFKSKLELFVSMVESTAGKLTMELKKAVDENADKPLSEQIDLAYQPLTRYYPVMASWVNMINTGGPSEGPSRAWKVFLKTMDQYRDDLVAIFAGIITNAQAKGEVRKDLPAATLAQMLIGFTSEVVLFGTGYFEIAKEVFLNGILTKEVEQ